MGAELQEFFTAIGTVVGKAPDLTIWLASMFFVFKMTLLLGPSWAVYKIIRIAIDRYHSIKTQPTRVDKTVTLDSEFICMDNSYEMFKEFLKEFVAYKSLHHKEMKNPPVTHTDSYLHQTDVKFS